MSAGSQPDFYMGMLEGALRVMVPWEWNVAGHTFSFNVFLPALVPLGAIFTAAAFWPFIEQWITGDRREHHVNDRPRNAPTRTALGIAVVTFYGILWAEGANDILAQHFDVPLYITTRIAQVTMFVGPVLAYILTKRICLGLQRKDAHLLEHGVETGIIRQLPNGEYIEETRPVSEEKRAALVFRSKPPGLPSSGEEDENGVPAPQMRGALGKVRARLYNIVTESAELEPSHGNGHGNGHGEDHAPAAVTSGEPTGTGSGTGEGDQHGS
jgi:ubiquinol-cytochrome c reductase cytochrome b subunit